MTAQAQENMGISPAEARKRDRKKMTYYEWNEILKYRQVWFVGRNTRVKIHGGSYKNNNYGYDDDYGNYTFSLGDHLAYRYEMLEKIGSGSFGDVVKCLDHQTYQYVAVKILSRMKKKRSINDNKEVKILNYLKEKDVFKTGNVVHQLINFIFRKHICIVFQLEGMDLAKVLHSKDGEGLSMDEVRCYAICLLNGLEFLEKNSIVHGDIKPDNIVMSYKDPSTVKLVDFGGSGIAPKRTVAHTMIYSSPEILLDKFVTPAHDMWSLGCTLVELYTGQCIFSADLNLDLMQEMVELLGKPPSTVFNDAPEWLHKFGNSKCMSWSQRMSTLVSRLQLPEDFAGFITDCLEYCPRKRMIPSKALLHPWITQEEGAWESFHNEMLQKQAWESSAAAMQKLGWEAFSAARLQEEASAAKEAQELAQALNSAKGVQDPALESHVAVEVQVIAPFWKQDNIVMSHKDPSTVKLVDFGGSGIAPKRTVAHTMIYTSPELLLEKSVTPAHVEWAGIMNESKLG